MKKVRTYCYSEVAWLTLGALLLRLLLWWGKFGRASYPHLFRDDEVYWQAGQDLWHSGMIGSHKVMPGLPLLNGLFGFPGIVYFNIFLSSLTVGLVFMWAKEVLTSGRLARWTACLVAVSPGLLYFSNHAYTESSFTFLLVLGLWALRRKHMWLASISLVLSVLVRPTLDLVNPLLILMAAWAWYGETGPKLALRLGQYALVYILLLFPWWLHQHEKYGTWVRLHLGGGEVMYHGQVNLPQLTSLHDAAVYDLSPFEGMEDPHLRNQAMIDSVFQHWQSHPFNLPKAAGLNGIKFWLGTPEVFYGPFAYLAGLWQHAGFLLLLLAGIFCPELRKRTWWPLWLLLAYFTAIHALLHGMPRYRLPLEPIIWTLVLAGWGDKLGWGKSADALPVES
ncbi:MAG: hypothetical protein AAF804_15200 [Bacteroidota bacterium]